MLSIKIRTFSKDCTQVLTAVLAGTVFAEGEAEM
jgi:hypothetical protein